MSVILTNEDRKTLRYLARQTGLLWGGVYERGGDPDLIHMQHRGLIEAVAEPYAVKKVKFAGGYRITDAGRRMIALTARA